MHISRRDFIATTSTVAALASLRATAQSAAPAAPPAGPKIKLGLIGCGGRGVWIAKFFQEHGGFEIHAVGDYFEDKAKAAGLKLGVDPSRCFSTLSNYKKVVESGVDAVAIITPPYFRPEQASFAVNAGKHVYCAKPVAVDVPGCKTIEQTGNAATGKKQVFLIDFQTRATPFFIEALDHVHAGDIGDIVYGEAMYHGGWPFGGHADAMRKNPNDPETRLHAWGMDKVLSGDIITEQFIHSLDVMNWVMQKPPLSATGACGLKTHDKLGTSADNFTAHIRYADSVGYTFSGMQFNDEGSQPGGIRVRAFGTGGVFEGEYGGNVMIRGAKMYRGGKCPGIYAEGAKTNIATFHKSIAEQNYSNPTIAPSVQSNLITILARTAAYTGEIVTWEKLMASTERLESEVIKGLKA
jgi:predicted dehydrogenase